VTDFAGPFFQASVDGQDFREDLKYKVLSFEVQLRRKELANLKFTIDNSEKTLLSEPSLALGKRVKFRYGYPTLNLWSVQRNFVISEIDPNYPQRGDPSVSYMAVARSFQASKLRRSDVIRQGKTLGQLVEGLTTKYQWTYVDEGGTPSIRTIYQSNESDIAMIRRVARDYGYEVFTFEKDGVINLRMSKDLEGSVPEKLWGYQRGGTGLPLESLISFKPKISRFNKPSGSRRTGIDPSTKEPQSKRASDTTTERDMGGEAAVSSETWSVSGESGKWGQGLMFPESSLAADEKPDYSPNDQEDGYYLEKPASPNPLEPSEDISECPSVSEKETKSLADSKFKEDERKMSRGTAVILGDPDIVVGMVIHLEGLDEPLNGNWVVEGVIHKVAPAPYLTTSTMRRKAVRKARDLGCVPSPLSKAKANTDAPLEEEKQNGEAPLVEVTVVDPETGKFSKELR